MTSRSVQTSITLNISAAERDTGLSKDTLRVWERRYGFPQPDRDAFGERAYPLEQIERLRVIRRLLDGGHRPGKLMALSDDALAMLALEADARPDPLASMGTDQDDLLRLIDLVKAHDVEALRAGLSQAAVRMGLDRFVMSVCAPLNALVGEAWARGQIEIFEEHLYTESIQVVLRNAISSIPAASPRPRVLLTTFPQEVHGLGLLMAEALLALEGCRCLSLGIQTPVMDIARAAQAQRADIVALSFSACLNANQVLDGLAELRARLDPGTDIWAGGQSAALQRALPSGIFTLRALADIGPAVQRWHADHPPL